MNILENLTVIIITYARNLCCYKVVNSWIENIPNIKIVLIDTNGNDSKLTFKDKNIQHIKTDFNIQPSLARNIGIDNVHTDYLFMSDDDDLAPASASIIECIEYIKQHNYIDILGIRPRLMNINNKTLTISKIINNNDIIKCDSVANHFIGRRSTMYKYDTNILFPYEHWDFFLSVKKINMNVYAHNLFKLNSVKSRYANKVYNKAKKQQSNDLIGKKLFYQKWNIDLISYE